MYTTDSIPGETRVPVLAEVGWAAGVTLAHALNTLARLGSVPPLRRHRRRQVHHRPGHRQLACPRPAGFLAYGTYIAGQ